MSTSSTKSAITLAVSLLLLAGASAGATSLRTFVSGSGNDANACSQSAPCATLAGALTNTSSGGEIYSLDAADYSSSGGTTTINKPVSIIGAGGRIGINAEMIITPGTGGMVLLKGLDVNANNGTGISMTAQGVTLIVDDCTVVNGNVDGIYFAPGGTGASYLVVRNSVISSSGPTGSSAVAGIVISPYSSGNAVATLDNVTLSNGFHGIYVTDSSNVTIRNSVMTQNTHSGLRAESLAGGTVTVLVERSQSSHNFNGIFAVGATATIRITDVTVTDNGNGIYYQNSGKVISFGNNSVDGNAASLTPTSTVALQ